MRERKDGQIVNISSIGVQTNAPRFSAYVASKAALDAFSRSIASEVVADGVCITTIYMPLVRTPMIAPTKFYEAVPTRSPDEAVDMIVDGIINRKKRVATRLGLFGEVSYALAPKLIDRILNTGFRLFPDSPRKGKEERTEAARARGRGVRPHHARHPLVGRRSRGGGGVGIEGFARPGTNRRRRQLLTPVKPQSRLTWRSDLQCIQVFN